MVDRLGRRRCWYAGVVAVLILQSVLTLTHRPWLDEYQALQIALQSPTLDGLSGNLRYEGHPPLWYWLLRLVGSLVPPAWVLAATAAPLALLTQATVLFRAPFARIDRALIATGALILFEYGAVSRSLTLGVALLVVAFAFRERRWSWLLVALLPMTDFLFGALSMILVAIQWRERRFWMPGVLLWCGIGLIAAWSVVPAPDMVPAFDRQPPVLAFGEWLNRLSVLLIPLQMNGAQLEWNNPLPLGIASIAGPLFLVFSWRQTAEDRWHRVLLVGFVSLTAMFSVLVYPLAIRHLSLIALLLILLRWRSAGMGRMPDRWFRLWLLGSALAGLVTTTVAVARPFDTATETARTIRALGLERAHWIAFPDSRGQGVSALLGLPFDKLGRDCSQTFIRWNYRSPVRTASQLTRALDRVATSYGRINLLSDMPISNPGAPGFYKPLARIPAGYDGQAFYLYAVRVDRPENPRRPLPCVAGQRPLRLS